MYVDQIKRSYWIAQWTVLNANNLWEKNPKKKIQVYVQLNQGPVHLKQTQHWKSTLHRWRRKTKWGGEGDIKKCYHPVVISPTISPRETVKTCADGQLIFTRGSQEKHLASRYILGYDIKKCFKQGRCSRTQVQELFHSPCLQKEKMSILLHIREMQIKTTKRDFLTPFTMVILQKKMLEMVWKNGNLPAPVVRR